MVGFLNQFDSAKHFDHLLSLCQESLPFSPLVGDRSLETVNIQPLVLAAFSLLDQSESNGFDIGIRIPSDSIKNVKNICTRPEGSDSLPFHVQWVYRCSKSR